MSISSKIYLPNLNTIRAIAALIVVVSHIERKKGLFGLKSISFIESWGNVGVTLFFVLSGFLITYLLLIEKNNLLKINVKDFYLRRILRIWPLYFFVLLFVYLVIPFLLPDYYLLEKDRFTIKSILLNVLFLTNVTMILKFTPLIINSIWSIGIEEQFYIFWPWVIKAKKSLLILVLIILGLPLFKIALIILSKVTNSNDILVLYKILTLTRFDSMAIGGFFGFLAFYKQIKLVSFTIKYEAFTTRKAQILIYSLLCFAFLLSQIFKITFNFINYQILPIFFALSIMNLATNTNSIICLENKITNFIGKISYSIYMNHLIVLYLFLPYLKVQIIEYSLFLKGFILYSSTLLLVVAISYITYNLYEKQFLKLKNRFSYVKT